MQAPARCGRRLPGAEPLVAGFARSHCAVGSQHHGLEEQWDFFRRVGLNWIVQKGL